MPNYYSDPYGSRKRVRLYIAIAAMILAAMFLHRHQLVVSAGDFDLAAGGGGGINACVVNWGCFRLATELTGPPANAAPAASPETGDDNFTIAI
jgi:hypothetical protein